MLVQVRPSQLDEWARSVGAHERAPVLLDVREPWEVQTASVAPEGFDLKVMPMGEIHAHFTALDPQRPVACLCHHGARSLRVAMFLAQNGFTQVANVSGGIDAWSLERDASVPRY